MPRLGLAPRTKSKPSSTYTYTQATHYVACLTTLESICVYGVGRVAELAVSEVEL